jgi:broad specificity phosphatase PhoE
MQDRSQTTLLYLIRHGATDANERRPYILQGRGLDGPLSERGERQAASVARLLAEFQIDAICSSPLRRAMQTAEAIAGSHGLEVQTESAITECDVGAWEGMDWGSIESEFPEAYRDFRRDSATSPYLRGESYRDVQQRVMPAIDRLLEQHSGKLLVVVAHNVVNRAYLAGLMGLDLSRATGIRQLNCGVNVIRRLDDQTELLTLNAHFHLAEELR